MVRVAHYLNGGKPTGYYPNDCIFFGTESNEREISENRVERELKFGWAVYIRRHDEVITHEEWFHFTTVTEFWDWTLSKIRSGRRVWMFAYSLIEHLQVLKWHHELYDVRGLDCSKAILPTQAPIPFLTDWKMGNKTLRIVDMANYYNVLGLGAIAEGIGMEKTDDCRQDVEIVKAAMLAYIDFVRENELGSFGISTASQAMRAFTARFMRPRSILVHNNEQVMKLERDAYLGARVELLNRQGNFDEDIVECDVNSMYAHEMVDNPIPVKLLDYQDAPGPCSRMTAHRLLELFKREVAVIARVRVHIPRSHAPIIPTRINGKLVYANGTFDAVLTTPELKMVCERGYLVHVTEYARYETERGVFTDYVKFFDHKRHEYREQGNVCFAFLCKMFMNALYGKFGQCTYNWEEAERGAKAVITPGTVQSISRKREPFFYRNIGGNVEKRENVKSESTNSVTAIAAHVIAWGRTRITNLIELAGGPANVIYCDTDSLHLVNDGYSRLEAAGMIHPIELGKLKRETFCTDDDGNYRPSRWGMYRAPKDYEIEGKDPRLKGVPMGSQEIDPGVFVVNTRRGLRGSLADGDLNTAVVSKVQRHISPDYTKGQVDPVTGRITPFYLHEGVIRQQNLLDGEGCEW